MNFYETFANSLVYKAPAMDLLLAKLLGHRLTYSDVEVTITGYRWRGKLYVTDFLYSSFAGTRPFQ